MLLAVLAGVAAIMLVVVIVTFLASRRHRVPPVAFMEAGVSHLRERGGS